MNALRQLSAPQMERLAQGLGSGQVRPPFGAQGLAYFVPKPLAKEIAIALNALCHKGMDASGVAATLGLLAEERRSAQRQADRLSLAWSGPRVIGSEGRETGAVVRELFRLAQREVWILSYAIDPSPKKVAHLFGELAAKMEADPSLKVRLGLNIKRPYGDNRPTDALVADFHHTFTTQLWPGAKPPALYFDPRSLNIGGETRACLHAKCVVVDHRYSFVTSANFTEAAHARNIELGVRFDDPALAQALVRRIEGLVGGGGLVGTGSV